MSTKSELAESAAKYVLKSSTNMERLRPMTKLIKMQRYGYVITIVALLGLQNYSFAFATQMPARNKAFNKEFMKNNFE